MGLLSRLFQPMYEPVPQPASAVPMTESNGGAVGSQPKTFSPGDHSHPRPVSVTYSTVLTGSTATVNFTRTFTNKPGIDITEVEGDTSATAQPATFKVQSWIMDTTNPLLYAGCIVKVWRAQTIPQNLASLLLGAVYSIFGASVVGTQFSCIAVARSDVAQ